MIKIKGLSEEEALDKAVLAVLGDFERSETWKTGGGRLESAFEGMKMVGELEPWLVPVPLPRAADAKPYNASEVLIEEDIDEAYNEDIDDDVPDIEERDASIPGVINSLANAPKEHKKRLIIIGDIHGMSGPLTKLLAKLKFNSVTDHIIATGDMTNKGPSSDVVVQTLMNLNASAVRGNHEDRVLLAWKGMHRKQLALQPTASQHPLPRSPPDEDTPTTEADDLLDIQLANTETFTRSKEYKDRLLAKKLGKKAMKWLESHPVILKVGEVQGLGNVVVVHGGLVPGVKLERQDPYSVMNMRTIDLRTRVPSEAHRGLCWSKLYNKFMRHITPLISAEKKNNHPALEPTTVVYGHDSRRGLQIEPYTKGVDTGCVRGGRLSAFVIEGGGEKIKTRVVSVSCKRKK